MEEAGKGHEDGTCPRLEARRGGGLELGVARQGDSTSAECSAAEAAVKRPALRTVPSVTLRDVIPRHDVVKASVYSFPLYPEKHNCLLFFSEEKMRPDVLIE